MSEERKPRRKRQSRLHGTKIGEERVRNRPRNPLPDKTIDICLNCTEKSCRGYCDKVKGSYL